MQTNLWLSPSGGWIVEYRYCGDHRWTVVGVYGTRAVAQEVYNRLWRR